MILRAHVLKEIQLEVFEAFDDGGRRALGGLEAATVWFENESNTDTEAGENVDERVSAEQVYASSKQVTYSRLGDP